MRKTMTGLVGTAALLLLLTTTAPLRAQNVVYREVFPNDTGANLNVGSANWQVNNTTNGTAANVATANTIYLSALNGRPAALAPVASNPISAELARGFYVDSSAGGTGYNSLVWTSEATVPITTFQSALVQWWQGNDAAADTDRVAVRVGSTWFVSNQTFAQASGLGGESNFAANAPLMSLNTNGAQWLLLNFTSGTTLGIANGAGPTSLPTNNGDVTGFGIYMDNKSSSVRFDTYQIIATPEPGAVSLFSIGALLLGGKLALRRKRRP